MNKIAIIIPSRLKAKRLENKPLKLINNKEMILHVYEAATKSKSGEVYVATPDEEIIKVVKKFGGNAIKTSDSHETGTDRVFEVFENVLKKEPKLIINLQGDMPNIEPKAISNLVNYMKKNQCDIATLAALLHPDHVYDPNVVKVFTKHIPQNKIKEAIKESAFSPVSDFHRNITTGHTDYGYHHIGIYGFTNKALIKYVNLKRSKLELERDLEQMRALENKMKIHVGYIGSSPLSVDTEEDLIEIRKIMEKNDKI